MARGREALHLPLQLARNLTQKIGRQNLDIPRALAQRRQLDRQDVQTV
jgi:hypothetical protein